MLIAHTVLTYNYVLALWAIEIMSAIPHLPVVTVSYFWVAVWVEVMNTGIFVRCLQEALHALTHALPLCILNNCRQLYDPLVVSVSL